MTPNAERGPTTRRPGLAFCARRKRLELGRRTAVMGVVNVTPDSFYTASRRLEPAEAVDAALAMVEAGASIIDIGGESTRPGARPVPLDEELSRIRPVVSGLRCQSDVLISVDTRKSRVAAEALDLGADLVNDVSSLTTDPRTAEAVARAGAGIVLMHMKGTPETMQLHPSYRNVIAEIKAFLRRAIERAEDSGVSPESILVDPGIGFGKTPQHNLQILNRLGDLASLRKPILVGPSRKSFIGDVLGVAPEDRLFGTAATVATAILRGAHVVRVHDAAEIAQVARMTDAIVNETLRIPVPRSTLEVAR